MLPLTVCSLSLVSVYAEAGFEVGGAAAIGAAAAVVGGAARPSRSAFSFSMRNLLSSLSAAILAWILFLAAMSSSFSCLFFAASLICSFTFSCSLISWLSFVFFLLISSLRFLSILSCSDIPARLAANFSRSSSSFAFFSSSVRGAISSVDSEKSWCSVLDAWNSACAVDRNFLPHSLQTRLRAASPGCRAGGSASADSLRSSSVFDEFVSSQSMASCTVGS
jgi:hypothetical protein